MGEAFIKFDPSSGLSAYNTTITFPTALNPGEDFPFNLLIGSPAGPGDTICFTVTLHELNEDEFHLNCCQFKVTLIMPDCEIEKCTCDNLEELLENISLGFDTNRTGPGLIEYELIPRGSFLACDEFSWRVRPRNPNGPWVNLGNGFTATYDFPKPGSYQIEMTVRRNDVNGETCGDRFRQVIDFNISETDDPTSSFSAYPNPATTDLLVIFPADSGTGTVTRMDIFSANGSRILTQPVAPVTGVKSKQETIDVRALPAGIYLLRLEGKDVSWTTRFVKR